MRVGDRQKIPRLGQDFLERLDDDIGVYASSHVRVRVSPGLGSYQGLELGDHQAASETGRAGVIAVDGRVRASQYDTAFLLQCLQALKVRGTRGQAFFKGVGNVGGKPTTSTLGRCLVTSRASSTLCSSGNSGFFLVLAATAMIT